MSGVAKKVIMITLGLLIAFGLLVAVIPEIQGSVAEISSIADEVVGVGDGVVKVFDFTLDRIPVEAGTLVVTDSVEILTDNGVGVLVGDGGGSGTIIYVTGVGQGTFFVAPLNLQDITADYDAEDVPPILLTLAGLWWIPIVLVMVALVVGGGVMIKRRIGGRGRSRRR